jgi:multidrug efflux pump subunit AcrA (membrane-fusion protein)
MKRIVLAGLVVLILLGGVWKVWGDVLILKLTDSGIMQSLTDAVISTEVGRRIMGLDVEEGDELEVRGSGVIQSQVDVVLSAESGGRVLVLGADEGDEVEAGTVLVRLDEELLLAQIAQTHAVVEAAEANLARVKADARAPEIEAARAAVDSAQAQVNAAQAAVDTAKANLEAAEARYRMVQAQFARLTAAPSEYQLEIAEQRIELAKDQLWAAQAQRDATKAGVDMPLSISFTLGDVDLGPIVIANPVSPKQLDVQATEALILEGETAIDVSRLQSDRLKAGIRAEDLAIMQADVAQAQADVQMARVALEQVQQAVSVAEAQLQQVQAQLDLILAGPRLGEVAVAEAQVAQAQAEVDILEVQREKLSLRTPIAGLVTERTVREGEVIVAGARLFTISRLDPVVLTIYISETKIGRVRVGQAADVSVDAYSGLAFRGEVVHIASRAEFTPRNIQTREGRTTTVFAVRIKLPNPEHPLKPGMPADATLR